MCLEFDVMERNPCGPMSGVRKCNIDKNFVFFSELFFVFQHLHLAIRLIDTHIQFQRGLNINELNAITSSMMTNLLWHIQYGSEIKISTILLSPRWSQSTRLLVNIREGTTFTFINFSSSTHFFFKSRFGAKWKIQKRRNGIESQILSKISQFQ